MNRSVIKTILKKTYHNAAFLLISFLPAINANAQIVDNFSDGNLALNPTWIGTLENFVSPTGTLQLNDTDPVITQSYLSTSSPMSDLNNKEWRIKVNQTFSGSDANQSRIYLTSSGPVLSYTSDNSALVTGYFLKLGEALSNDVVRFYRDDASAITLLASGTTNISTSFDISIRVTRDASGNWIVGIDPTGGETYINEMNFVETTLNASDYFGIVCTYTSSNADNFFFDDVYIGDLVVDTTPPVVLFASALSAQDIDVQFSEPVDLTTSETVSNYNVTGIGSPVTSERDISDPSIVHLTFGSAFQANQTYTLETSAISDLSGNIMTVTAQNDFVWIQSAVASYREVVFNEILADPTPVVGLPEAEFVELHNTSVSSSFDLGDWKFVNSTTEKTLPTYLLPPGEFVVLCDEEYASLFSSGVIGIPSFTALTNGGDSLSLLNNSGDLIDVVVYSDDWFTSPEKLEGGWTLEMVNPLLPCQTSGNWRESTNEDGGTPGFVNSVFDNTPDNTLPVVTSITVASPTSLVISFSETMDTTGFSSVIWDVFPFNTAYNGQWNSTSDAVQMQIQSPLSAPNTYTLVINGISDCSGNEINAVNIELTIGFIPEPGDLIINEILADETPEVGLPAAEFIEIRNNTNTLIDATSLMINSGFFTQQVLIEPNGFIVVTDANNIAMFNEIAVAVPMESFPGLTNSAMDLELTLSDGTMMEAVSYSLAWYKDDTKEDGGWSLERINPFAICSGSYNWKASENLSGGTPGLENSVYNAAPNGIPYVVEHGALNANQLYVRFTESMDIASIANVDLALTPDNSLSTPVWNTDRELLIIAVTDALIPEVIYQWNITGLMDCEGNQVSPFTLSFMIGLEPQPGEVIINEIMADASSDSHVATPTTDFIEIYNRTSHYIELTRMRINEGFFGQQVVIAPDSFIIVADNSNAPTIFYAYPNGYLMNGFPALTEAGTEIIISADNVELDRVFYNKGYYQDPEKEEGGYSMERINPEDPCSASDNWRACIAASGSTAGQLNSVYDITPDTSSPVLYNILATTDTSVTLIFSEPLDITTVDLTWTVNGVLQEDFNPTLSGDDYNMLTLEYGDMVSGIFYEFTLLGIVDCWGNESGNIMGRFAIPETAESGDVIINEILFNPYDGGEDFIEIYNNSAKAISLKDWQIADATNGEMNSADVITELDLLFFPGEYLVLTQNVSQVTGFYAGAIAQRMIVVEGLADFSSEDKVFLLTPQNIIIDELTYDEEMHYPLLDNTDGVSLERISFDRPSTDRTNWHSASEFSGFATPGYLNSQASAVAVSGNTLQTDTEIFSPDNDGYKDVITFSYTLEEPGYTGELRIYDSEGRLVRTLMQGELLGHSGSLSWDGFNDNRQKASIGIYIAYFEAFDTKGDVVRSKKACVLAHSLN